MANFKINDKTENTNPDSQSFVLVEKTGQPGVYEKVKIQNLPSSGGGSWGSIAGTLSDQTDLQTELDGKELKSSQVAFSQETTFNGNTYSYTSQTGVINKTIASTGQPTSGEHIHEDIIDGDSTNAINVTVDGGVIGSIDNTKRNIISLIHNTDLPSGKTRAVISTVAIPTAPTQPLVSSATVENGADTQLVVLFDQDSNIVDTTGLSLNFTSGTPLTITGIASGAGTSTITFNLSGSVQGGDVFTFDYDVTNTVTGLVGGLSLAAGSTSVTNNVSSADITSNLVNLYEFEGDLTDSTVNNNDATNTGITFDVSAKQGSNSGSFSGSNSYATVPNSIGGDWTFTAWINPDSQGTRTIFGSQTGETDRIIWWNSGTTITAGQGGLGNVTGSVTISTGVYTHIAVTLNSSTGLISIYVNGSLDTTGTATVNNANSLMQIGRYKTNAQNFDGLMDDVRIYARELTSQDIQAVYDLYA